MRIIIVIVTTTIIIINWYCTLENQTTFVG